MIRIRRFIHDVRWFSVLGLRQIVREPTALIPAVGVPVFTYIMILGSLGNVASYYGSQHYGEGFDFKGFVLPLSIVFAVTGLSRAQTVVGYISDGYFDRLMAAPVRRGSLLVGLMISDAALMVGLTIVVLVVGVIAGVDFVTGIPGMVGICLISAFWGLAVAGFPYALALRTGSPVVVGASYAMFFPVIFLSTAFLPKQALAGWLGTIATYNPVTYVLSGLRSLILEGWSSSQLIDCAIAIASVATIGLSLAFASLRSRIGSRR